MTRRTRSLQFDVLEDRNCPSTVIVDAGVLVVQGDDEANSIAITDDGAGNLTAVVDGQTYNASNISKVVVHGRDGDDDFSYQLTGERTTGLRLNLHMGDDNDLVTLDFAAGFSGPHLKVNLHTGKGDDQVFTTLGDLTNVDLFFNVHLHKGDDLFDLDLVGSTDAEDPTILLPGEITNSRVRFHVFGHQGADIVDIDALGVNLDSASLLKVKWHGQQGSDQFFLDYQGEMNGRLVLQADGSQGNDTVAANLTLDAGSTPDLYARVKGGPGNDDLTLNVSAADSSAVDGDLLIDGGPGRDTCVHTDNVIAVRCEA